MYSRASWSLCLSVLAAFLLLAGCASANKPIVWQASNVTFDQYKGLEVRPVFNATDKTFFRGLDVPARLTELLNDGFRNHGLQIYESPQAGEGILIVQTDLLIYEAYVASRDFRRWWIQGEGKTQCTLRARLIDKETGHFVAEVVSSRVAGSGGAYVVPNSPSVINDRSNEKVMRQAAEDIVTEISRIVPP